MTEPKEWDRVKSPETGLYGEIVCLFNYGGTKSCSVSWEDGSSSELFGEQIKEHLVSDNDKPTLNDIYNLQILILTRLNSLKITSD